MTATVQENADRRRFEVLADGEVAGFAQYRVDGDRVVVLHTEVDPARRGQGLAQLLAEETLRALRDSGRTVVPVCPFFARYLREHPEHADVVAA
ncbi:GNAT family N-acetyltransferase [Spirilliplanes yamanashiensis]|uniref:N-acetyltransferase n=1 Tax=Spirilliplanes yamanashiensis TaxID=42233 RepID=A0A8J3YBY3_9ACTN|nr:GNAT family N-acetyltransferase [Spirilliplanes yamanashiensis]MDP9818710.1 putative GNAT family acetyltransferase [Spirilliplanes yamanashiensis]GIJ05165.1 N-acetyltransferase [Spirilliplanes yamanashiensis]